MEEHFGALAAIPLAKLLGDVGAVILCLGIAITLLVFTFGINMSDIIQRIAEKLEENRQVREEQKEQRRKERFEQIEEDIEQENHVKEKIKNTKKIKQEKNEPEMENQIKINFGGRIVDTEELKEQKNISIKQMI